jgi:5'-3' exonuclease
MFESNPILLIDGSSLAFLHGNKENYKESLRSHIEVLLNKYNTKKYVLILENSKTNFRNKIATTNEYKGQRRTEKSISNIKQYLPYLSDVFKEIKESYNPVLYNNIENDDAIRILANRLKNVIICTNDKDMYCVYGRHHNLKSNKVLYIQKPGTIEFIDNKIHATGLYNIYFKILKGSQKENYKGLPGYGDKKVFSLLKNLTTEEEMQDVCVEHFKLIYGIEYKSKLNEGFRICWILEENNNLETPTIINYDLIKLNFK